MKLGLAQINIVWEDKERNKLRCSEIISKAKEKNINLIVFPEMTLTGFSMNIELVGEFFEKSSTIDFFKNQAVTKNISIGFGYVEKTAKSALNKFIIINEQGALICNYSKIHPFSNGDESIYYEGGDKLEYCELNNVILSPLICYDLRFPEVFQICSRKSSLIVIIANWPKSRIDHWITLLKARAIENQCYIAGVNRVGCGNNILYNGNSMIINPYGIVETEKINGEGILTMDISIEKVKTYRNEFKLKNDRKESLYLKLYNELQK